MITAISMLKRENTIKLLNIVNIPMQVFQPVSDLHRTNVMNLVMSRELEEDFQFGSCCFAGRKSKMEVLDWF